MLEMDLNCNRIKTAKRDFTILYNLRKEYEKRVFSYKFEKCKQDIAFWIIYSIY